MRTIDRTAFRTAARTSRVAGGCPARPSLADVRHEEHVRTILEERVRPRLRSTWVDAIVAAVRSDILAARRHA
jgi:hypothetical protein